MLEAATTNPLAREVATHIKDGWEKFKVEAGESIDEVTKNMLKLLDLDEEMMLRSPPFKKYYWLLKKKHGDNELKAAMNMARDLSALYNAVDNDDAFLKMLEKSSKNPATRKMAIELQDGFMNYQFNKRATASTMLEIYRLDRFDVEEVLSLPRFKWWVKSVTKKLYKGQRGVAMVNMAEAMSDCYGRVPLLEMLKKYKKDLEMKEIADALWKALEKLRRSKPQN